MTPIRIHRMNLEVLSPHQGCCNPPAPASTCCNTIRVHMSDSATLTCRLTNVVRPRVRFDARAVMVGRLTNA
jgi:hypothetical protein